MDGCVDQHLGGWQGWAWEKIFDRTIFLVAAEVAQALSVPHSYHGAWENLVPLTVFTAILLVR
eukprot:978004-Ditylum_brightwellii.AAC.1